MADETVSVGLTADNKSFIQAFNDGAEAVKNLNSAGVTMGKTWTKVSSAMQASADAIVGSLKKVALVGGAAIAGIGFQVHKGLQNFSSFETSMANVATVADTSTMSLQTMGETVMKMTSKFPQSAEELATGLYEVNSAGFQGVQGMKVLDATAKLATAGMIDMTTAVRGTASILNAYQLGGNQAAHVTDVIFKAVEVGQMTAQEFTMNIGDWAAAASSLNVPFETASAALATMTTKGALPAAQASTSLQAIFRGFIKPTDDMTKAITRAGFSSGKAMLQQLGFAKTLNTLWEGSKKNEQTFAKLFQDTEALRGGLGLVNSGYQMLVQTQEEFNNGSETAGTVQKAFELQMDTLSNKTKLFANEVRQMGFEMGKMVAPIAAVFVELGTTALHALNSIPEPLRGMLATLQLLAPALAIVGGLLVASVVKKKIWDKAFEVIAKAPIMSKLPTQMLDLIKRMGTAGGPIKFLRNEILKFAAADATVRAGMFRTIGVVGLYAGAFALAVIAITSLVGAISNAKQKASELKASFVAPDSGQIKSVKDLTQAYQDAVTANQDAFGKSGGNSVVNNLLASLQMITPFTENTKLNAKVASDAMAQLAGDYQTLFQAATHFSEMTGLSTDQVLQSLNQMAADGTVSIDTLMTQYKKYLQLLRDPGVNKFEQAKAFAGQMSGALGQPTPKIDPKDFMDPKMAAEWERLNSIFGTTQDELEKVAAAQKQVQAANASSTASAQEYALAMIALADSASTASEKLSAYSTIIGQLLGNTVDMRDSQSAFIQSIEKAGQAMVDNGAHFDLTTEKGQNLQAAISAASNATAALAVETVKQTGHQEDGIPIIASYIQGMIGVAQQAGFSQDSIAQMIATMGLTPATIESIISLPGMDPEMAKLINLSTMLFGLNGYVAQAGVNIAITTSLDTGAAGTHHEFDTPGQTPAQVAQQSVADLLKGIKANIPKTAGKKGGGGKGGGGAAKWKPTAEQLRAMAAALTAPVVDMLTGDLGSTWAKQMADQWMSATTKNMLSEGNTRLGAGILKAAQKEGKDPNDELQKAADDYIRLSKLIGKANADNVLAMTDNLDVFSKYVDSVEALVKHQQDVEDWKADRGDIDLKDYRAMLVTRLGALEAYSDDWMAIQDKIKSVDEQIVQKQKDNASEEHRVQKARLDLGEISKADYLKYLRDQLVGLTKYSEEWMAIWQEINDVEKQVVDDQKTRSDAVKSFADDVKKAFDDIKRSVSDPMIQATSLIQAFGDQTVVTADQVQAFYSHMLEGTQRWVTVIKALKEQGVNKSFLTELINAGPQSLSFAEQVLAMGPGGISMINQNMADIADLSNGLGTDIATGQVGTLNQNDNSITINVGDITITGDMPDGVTLDSVTGAITTALGGIAVQVGNRTFHANTTV